MAGKKYGIDTDEVDRAVHDAFDEMNNESNIKSAITIHDPIEYVEGIILKEAKREDRLVRQLLITMLSSKTSNPINLAINAPTGEGKNWVLEKVAALFPEDEVIFLHGMTDKALFHEQGTLVIKDTEIDFVAFKLELDETEKDKFGYYSFDYVESEIDKQSKEALATEEEGSEGYKELALKIGQDTNSLRRFVKKLIDLEHKILIFLDTPRMSLFEALMPLLSHDKYESEYKYVDTSAGIKTYKNLLRGWPCFIFAQAIDYSEYKRFPELQRRFIITNPTMDSKEKYSEAIDLIVDKYSLPDLVYQKLIVSDEDKNKARDIIKYISDKILQICSTVEPGKNSSFVPFATAVNSGLAREQTSDMNAAKRTMSFISLLPMVNFMHRPFIRIHTGQDDENGSITHTIPLAVFDDLIVAAYMMQYSNGVRPYVLEWYYEIFLTVYNSQTTVISKTKRIGKEDVIIKESRIAVTSNMLIAATKEKKHKSYTSKSIHEQFIYPLMNQGYIDSMKSETNGSMNIYFPANEEDTSKNTIFSTTDNRRLNTYKMPRINVIDSTTFPSKEYLISRIEGVLKLSSEDPINVTLCDEEGNDIPVDVLIDRYYQNPEKYFNTKTETSTKKASPDDSFSKGENGVILQQNDEKDVKPIESKSQDSNKIVVGELSLKRQYSDFLVDGYSHMAKRE